MPRPQPFAGFKNFLRNYGVASLALGVVIGSAVNDLVKALVDGLVTPFVSLISGSGKLQHFTYTLHGAVFQIGTVIGALITFLAICWVVYLSVKLILRNEELLEKK